MSKKVTLGGERLGSGNKMQVELSNYERSTHDLGYIFRSTMAAGTLVPFMCEVALPGDTFDINLNADIMTHPTIGPLFGSYKVQLDVFQAPIRLYNAKLHNNAINIGRKMSDIKLPLITLTATATPEGTEDLDNSQVNPSCLLSYLGIRGIGHTNETITRSFNAVPTLAYWEIYKNYYSNKQEEIGAYLHTPATTLIETITAIEIDGITVEESPTERLIQLNQGTYMTYSFTGAEPDRTQIYLKTMELGEITLAYLSDSWGMQNVGVRNTVYNGRLGTLTIINWRYRTAGDLYDDMPQVHTFALSNIDDMRTKILQHPGPGAFELNSVLLKPYTDLVGVSETIPNILSTQEGLGLKTYQSDLFNNWLSTEWIDGPGGINEITAISTAGDSFTIDTLNLSRKVYDMLNRIAVSGGTYTDWLDAVYSHSHYGAAESPIYHGGLIKELVFQEVVSNAGTETGDPLGTLAGKGILSKKHKGGSVYVKVDEPSYLIGIVSLTPRVDYSQGNKWDVHLKTMDDFHKPALDEIGFQDLITEQMAWWDTSWDTVSNVWRTKSAGKQPAWVNYMTNVNRVYGNFAISNNEMFMTLNRRYEAETISEGVQIADLTTYIDPAKFNHIFAQTSRDAQNFWTQISVDITARRKMSAKVMPNL